MGFMGEISEELGYNQAIKDFKMDKNKLDRLKHFIEMRLKESQTMYDHKPCDVRWGEIRTCEAILEYINAL